MWATFPNDSSSCERVEHVSKWDLLLDSYWRLSYSALAPILAVIKPLMREQEDPDNQCKWASGRTEPSAICQAHLV